MAPGGWLLYIVHMKKVTASEARQRWFAILDEAAAGEVIVVERKGHRLVLQREAPEKTERIERGPVYRRLLRVANAEEADRWSWRWGAKSGVVPRRARAR